MRVQLLALFVLAFAFASAITAADAPPIALPDGKPGSTLRNALPSRQTGGYRPLMHAVVVVDTDAPHLENHLKYDYACLSYSLLTPVSEHGRLANWRILYGSTATPANAIQTVQSLTVSPADTLLVYYTGHGAINTSDNGHYLTMTHGNLSRKQLVQAIAAKHPRLGILVTDCCSAFCTLPPRTQVSTTQFQPAANWSTIERLFFAPRGRVSVTAARPGNLAYSTVFTTAFCSALTANPTELAMGTRNWSPFLEQVTMRTKAIFQFEQPCHCFYLGPWERSPSIPQRALVVAMR